jgi:type II secretory pathway component GspD/PulD (secretin)
MRPHRLLFAFLALSMPAALAEARAQDVRLDVVSQPLADVVATLSFMSGIPVITMGTLSGTVENWSVKDEGIAAFAALGRASNLFVAYDGSRMIIAPKSEVETVVLERGGRSWRSARNAVDSLFPLYPDDAIMHEAESDVVIVRGPSAFVAAIEKLLSQPGGETVQVIRGGVLETVPRSSFN